MSVDDLDYEKDVLKFKQIWGDIKKQQSSPHCIQEPNQEPLLPRNKSKGSHAGKKQYKSTLKNQSVKGKNNQNNKATVVSEHNIKKITRNPLPNPQQVIQVETKPAKQQYDSMINEKNALAAQRLILEPELAGQMGYTGGLMREIQEKNVELSLLRVANQRNEGRIRSLENEIEKRDRTIEELQGRQRQLIEQKSSLMSKDFNFNYGKVEYENFKNDSRRLLKMLKNTSEYRDMATLALEDGGVRFLHAANSKFKTKIDAPAESVHLHFCTCNKQFIPESGLWVPDKVYQFCKSFVKERSGDLSNAELQLLLYEVNRIWRQREKRIINSIRAQKASEVGKYKRKFNNITTERKGK